MLVRTTYMMNHVSNCRIFIQDREIDSQRYQKNNNSHKINILEILKRLANAIIRVFNENFRFLQIFIVHK